MKYSFRRLTVRALLGIVGSVFICGCGADRFVSSNGPPPPLPGESTQVTVLLSANANQKLLSYSIVLGSLVLSTDSGQSATIKLNSSVELIHSSDQPEILITTSIPQGIYTGGTLGIGAYAATFIPQQNPATDPLTTQTVFNDAAVSAFPLPLEGPITVSGNALTMVLSPTIAPGALPNTPTDLSAQPFTLSAFRPGNSPASIKDGQFNNLRGRVQSVTSSQIVFTRSDENGSSTAPSIALPLAPATMVNGLLRPDSFISCNGTLNASGSSTTYSVLADDPETHNEYAGVVYGATQTPRTLNIVGVEMEGDYYSNQPVISRNFIYDSSTFFNTQADPQELVSAPFPSVFDADHIVVGQYVKVSLGTVTPNSIPVPFSFTLLPQTINGLISDIQPASSFTRYTLTLSAESAIPILTGNNSVYIYVRATTTRLNTQPIKIGNYLRATGLLFVDTGSLKMLARQIDDGIPE